MRKIEKTTICSRCGEPKLSMYHPEFVYQSENPNRTLYRPEKLKDIYLCANCCSQIVEGLLIDDILEKVIFYRENKGYSIDRIGEIIHQHRDVLVKKYSAYLKRLAKSLNPEDVNKIGALYRAGWKTKDIYYDFNQKIPLDIVSMITNGKMWKHKNTKDFKKENDDE